MSSDIRGPLVKKYEPPTRGDYAIMGGLGVAFTVFLIWAGTTLMPAQGATGVFGFLLLLVAFIIGLSTATVIRKAIFRPKTVSVHANGIAFNDKFLPWQFVARVELEKMVIENSGTTSYHFTWKFHLRGGGRFDFRLTERDDGSDYIDIEEFNRLLAVFTIHR